MSQRVKNAMVPHLAQRLRQNACLFTLVLYESEVKRKMEGDLKRISVRFLSTRVLFVTLAYISFGTKLITQINDDGNAPTLLRLTGQEA